MFPDFDYGERLTRAKALMDGRRLDVLLLSVGADLPYLTGYEAMASERLTMLVLPAAGSATLVVPRLESPRVPDPGGALAVVPWGEHEDPAGIVADLAGDSRSVGVGDRTWSGFLLQIQARMPCAEFVSATPLLSEMRVCKEPGEIERLRRAAQAADRVVEQLGGERFAGRTEADISRTIADLLLQEGHDTAEFAIVASGPNGASPHHEPGKRVIGAGDGVVVDIGGRLDGYHSDTTRTFCVGDPPTRFDDAFAVLREAQAAAVETAGPGIAAEAVDRAARRVIAGAGYGEFFVHRTGHGIGLDVHEEPYIIEGNRRLLESGMAFSVEPGIYLPGDFGMRIEDIVVVTADGRERLNRSSRGVHLVE